MSCGLLPNTTTIKTNPATTLNPKQPFLTPRKLQPSISKTHKWPSLYCSSSFKTRATVEEGGFIGAKSGESFYELLGISEGVGFDDIKRAYKQMARKYHPDVSPPDRTEEFTRRFIEVHEAYEILSDPSTRALYDRDLSRGFHFVFQSRRRRRSFDHDDDELDERSQWKNRWQCQVSELKRRSMNNEDSTENLSWGARMRRQRAESSP